jgi:hypothetical protein
VSVVAIPFGKGSLEVRLTPRAKDALATLEAPLAVELELYFSCLIRKRVIFTTVSLHDAAASGRLSDQVSVAFRPVMTKACSLGEAAGKPDLETFPIVKAAAFTPKWLELDRVHGEWRGEFGW